MFFLKKKNPDKTENKKAQAPPDADSFRFEYRGEQKIDRFMRAWVMLGSDRDGISAFNRKHREKELRQYLGDLGILLSGSGESLSFSYAQVSGGKDTGSPGEGLLHAWQQFARDWCKVYMRDPAYRAAFLGMFPKKDPEVLRQMAEDIDYVTSQLPAAFGFDGACAPLRRIMLDAVEARRQKLLQEEDE